MADRKVYVTATIELVLDVEEGVDVDDVIGSLAIWDAIGEQDVPDFTISDVNITDSK